MAITDRQSWSCLFQIKFHVICIQTTWNNTKSNRISLLFHQFSWNSKRRETFKSELTSQSPTVKITTSIEYIELTTCTKKKDILDRIITFIVAICDHFCNLLYVIAKLFSVLGINKSIGRLLQVPKIALMEDYLY